MGVKKILYFINYENRHGRETDVVCENADILLRVNNAILNPKSIENAKLPIKIRECTSCNHKGCLTQFVCHTASIDNAKKIFASRKLLSAIKSSAKTVEELILDKRNGASDPADYFEYIMFAWGNCFAGDSLIVERNFVENLGRTPNDEELKEELEKNFTPGIRFYFRNDDIIKHYNFCFDGYHPAKIKNELIPEEYLFACVIPKQLKTAISDLIPLKIKSKVHFISQDGIGMRDWSEKVYNFIESLEG